MAQDGGTGRLNTKTWISRGPRDQTATCYNGISDHKNGLVWQRQPPPPRPTIAERWQTPQLPLAEASSAHARALPFPSGPPQMEPPPAAWTQQQAPTHRPGPALPLNEPLHWAATPPPHRCRRPKPQDHPDLSFSLLGPMLVPKGTPPSSTTLGQRSPQLRLLVSPPAPPYIPSAPHHRHHQQPIRRGGATPPPLTRPMGGRGARHAANQEAQVPPSPLPATAPQCEKPPQPHPPPSLSRPEDARGAVSAPPYPHPTP